MKTITAIIGVLAALTAVAAVIGSFLAWVDAEPEHWWRG